MEVTWFHIICKINSSSPPEPFGKCPEVLVSGEAMALATEGHKLTKRKEAEHWNQNITVLLGSWVQMALT